MKSIGLALTLIVLVPQTSLADAVTDWNASAGKAALVSCLSPGYDPFHESRAYAMAHIAIHDALNAIERRSRPYAYDGHAPGASPTAAVAAAARDVLVVVLGEAPSFNGLPGCSATPQDGVNSVQADYAAAVAAIPDGQAKTRGLQVGQAAAAAVLALRAGDGADTPFADPNFETGTEPGQWRFTPGFDFAVVPGWRDVTPFVLRDSAQFRPGPPYKLNDPKYTKDFIEIFNFGGDDITTDSSRNAEQTQIGLFWVESSPLAWNRLTRTVSSSQGLGLWENARLFGLLNMALADGYIASVDTKYHYNFWRPISAIREADTDGNPETLADPTWTPLIGTPPFPDYDSAHAVEGGAAAEVLKQFFGTDAIPFTACSLTLPSGQTCNDPIPAPRTFSTFSEAADENADSRVLIGIHFRDAVETGVEHGRKIGRRAANLFMKPAH